jgi:hypothetical protein
MAKRKAKTVNPEEIMGRVGQLLGQSVNALGEVSDDLAEASELLDQYIKLNLDDSSADAGYAAEGARLVGVLDVRQDLVDQTTAHLGELVDAINGVFGVETQGVDLDDDDEGEPPDDDEYDDDVVQEPRSGYVR